MHLSTAAGAVTPADDEVDFRELMEEPAGGRNYGRVATIAPEELGRQVPLSVEDAQTREFVKSGGWTIVDPIHDGRASGAVAHRGAVHPGEYVDPDVVRAAIEDALGFTTDEIRSVYRQGRLTPDQGELRSRIDARLLALSRRGAKVHAIGRELGFTMTPKPKGGDECKTIRAALARARAAEKTS